MIGNDVVQSFSREIKRFLLALQFLTCVPMSSALSRWVGFSTTELSASARYFPWVGLLIGVFASCVWIGCSMLWSPWIAAALTVAFTAWITGAFHEDGLADTADALGGAISRERALTIMKDSRIGTYGAVALILVLGVRIGALASMSTPLAVLALIFAHSAGRAGACVVLATLPYVRDDDSSKSKPLARSMHRIELVVALSAPLLVALIAVAFYAYGYILLIATRVQFALYFVISIIGATVIVLWWRRVLLRRIGGFTGDTLGAVEQFIEVAIMLVFAANFT